MSGGESLRHGHLSLGQSSLPGAGCHCSQPPVAPQVLVVGFRDCSPSLSLLPTLGSLYKGPPGQGHLGRRCPGVSSLWPPIKLRDWSHSDLHLITRPNLAAVWMLPLVRARFQAGGFADSSRCDLNCICAWRESLPASRTLLSGVELRGSFWLGGPGWRPWNTAWLGDSPALLKSASLLSHAPPNRG